MTVIARLLFRLGLTGVAIGLVAACTGVNAQSTLASTRPPNIVIILADDAGYADFGFMGSEQFRTPHIDRLAREGIVYDAAYATMPFCSPSRAGLLTGRYTQRFGYEFNLTHAPPPGVDPEFMGLATNEETIATLLGRLGYATIAIGKWHVGDRPQFHPNRRGFDHFYGFLGGGSSYFPQSMATGTVERNGIAASARGYLTDDLAREAAEQIAVHRDRPFLLYLAFNAVHTPMESRPGDEARYSDIADPQRRRLAAMTWALDRAVGTVVAALDREGMLDETLIVFTNDNGGDRVGLDADNRPLRGTKGTLLEGGIRVPMVVRLPGGSGGGRRAMGMVSLMDILPTALDLAGATIPDDLDGRSLLDPAKADRRMLAWRYDNMAAIRQGSWKLLRYPDRPAELYDLSADIGEATNLAPDRPGKVRAMMQDLFAWEAGIEHPRWHTGSYWSQEDVRRYSEKHVETAIAQGKASFAVPPEN